MFQMLTAPGLTLLFLGVVVGLGVSFVWMLWEIEQMSKSHRNERSLRIGCADSSARRAADTAPPCGDS